MKTIPVSSFTCFLIYNFKAFHNVNLPMSCTSLFYGCKYDNCQMKVVKISLFWLKNIAHQGGSNEYSQSIFYADVAVNCLGDLM